MKNENWKDIPGYEGRYQVSDHGRVRSLDRQVRTVSRTGTETTRRVRGRYLKPQRHTHDYVQFTVEGRVMLAHAAVLAAFVGPCPPGMGSAHGDGNRKNNALSNLRYATPLENANDKRIHGTSGRGEDNTRSKLTAQQVAAIRDAAGKVAQKALAKQYGVRQATISKIVRGERWVHA